MNDGRPSKQGPARPQEIYRTPGEAAFFVADFPSAPSNRLSASVLGGGRRRL